jgi:uncharacterized protein (DUF1330 family)
MQEAYIIGNITVKDETRWAEYKSKVPDTLIPWGGTLVFRGETLTDFKNSSARADSSHTDNVIIKFPNQQSLDNWIESDAYQALIPNRDLAANIDLVSYLSMA